MAKKRAATQRTGRDWKKARRLYERSGKTFVEIAEVLGCAAKTVSAHAKRERWVSGTRVARETAVEREQKIFREFVERDSEAIHRNLAEKHRINGRILAATSKILAKVEENLGLERGVELGEGVTIVFADDADPALVLRRLALTVQTVEVVDRSIAGLKDDGWRSDPGRSGADTETRSDRLARAMDEVEADLGGRR